jgi:CubicO group peptidase (beta-lactamase class C family)
VGGLLVVALAWMLLIYPAEYVGRTLFWLEADVDDHLRFPERAMAASGSPLVLPVDTAPEVINALGSVLGADDPETVLAELETQALIVIRDGTVIYEGYFNGFARDSIATSFSVAKSFDSTLIGIASAEGLIESIDQPITDYLPELLDRDPRFGDISIRDLMSMSSGIHYEESGLPPGDDAKTYYWPDMRDLALNQTSIDEPSGGRFHYNNYNPLLEGLIIERATGMSVTDYLASRLWQPMGAQFPGSWSLDSADGFEKMESGINARPIDFAKLGVLFLGNGSINENSVVPSEWVTMATTPTYPAGSDWYIPQIEPSAPIGYGLHWWTIEGSHGVDYTARGNHGQFVYVSPASDMVIVRNGRSDGMNSGLWMATFYSLADELGS